MRLALAQFAVTEPARWDEFADLVSHWTADAAAQGAELLVYPEYAAMGLAATLGPAKHDLQAQLAGMQALWPAWCALHQGLAQKHAVYLVAGSFPRIVEGRTVNRALICAPDGRASYQDKQMMTRFEREQWGIARGDGLRVFATELGRFAVQICYDIEFPLLSRALCEAGAQLLLAPSCTDTTAGYWRVRLGAQSRALENQCPVAQSPLVGEAPWSPAVDVNVGAAGVYLPPDYGCPDDGLLCKGEWNAAQWLYASLDLPEIARVRREGQVLNWRDWPEQSPAQALPPISAERL